MYVGVYILVLMYNSPSMCYLKNIVENFRNINYKNIYTFLKLKKIAMKWMQIFNTCVNSIQFNSITKDKASKNAN